MTGEFAAVRAHPAVIVSVVAAAITVTACALVAIAYMLGWVPAKGTAAKGVAAPEKQVAGTAPGVVLLPGEILVAEPDTPKPVTPSYATSAPARPDVEPPTAAAKRPVAPPTVVPPPSRAQPTTPSFAKTLPSRAAPSAPKYLPEESPPESPRSYERSIRGVCLNCGIVTSIGPFGDDWEVRVRFEDGSSQAIRYPDRPRLRVGERVHLEDGRLLPD